MKYASFLLLIGTSFLAGGCLTGIGQAAHGGVAGSLGAPNIASAAPENSPDSASGDPSSAGEPSVMSKIGPDPSGGSDAPITVLGFPVGVSPKPHPHDGEGCDGSGYHICFQKVSATFVGPASDAGRFEYELAGTLLRKYDDGTVVEMPQERIGVTDLLFETNVGHWLTGAASGYFDFNVISPVGRGVGLSASECYHQTQVDLTLPDASTSPVTVDPCSSGDPTDVYTPPDGSQNPPPPSPIVTPPHQPPSDGSGVEDTGDSSDDIWWKIHHRLERGL